MLPLVIIATLLTKLILHIFLIGKDGSKRSDKFSPSYFIPIEFFFPIPIDLGGGKFRKHVLAGNISYIAFIILFAVYIITKQ
jgi:hypothetical protein